MEEAKYRLTVKGLFEAIIPGKGNTLDQIELYLRRNEYNAIILSDEGFVFASVELEDADDTNT